MDLLIEELESYLDPGKEWSDDEAMQLGMLLRFAASKIINRRYPFDDTVTEVPAKYHMTQIQIAAELYARMGAEGQTAHSENGISRTWESADAAQSLLQEVVPMVGTFGG